MPFDFAFVRLWVEFAKQDARVALLIVERQKENAQFALYHVQQSIEKASKALLLLTGNPKYNMRYMRKNLRHNSLKASLEFIRINVIIEELKPLVKRSVKGDVYARLNKVIGKSRAYSDELAWLPPHILDSFLRIPGQITSDKLLAETTPDHAITIKLEQVDENDVLGSLIDLVISHLNRDKADKEEVRLCIQKIIEAIGEENILSELRSNGTSKIDIRNLIEDLFTFTRIVVGLYVMSALTSSHEATTRYPSEPGANRQYDASVGAIVLIKDLAKEADRIATDFLEHFDEIAERIRTLHDSYSSEEGSSSC